MLILVRKPDEKIIIDNKITVTVMSVRGEKVWLSLEFPREEIKSMRFDPPLKQNGRRNQQ